MGYCNPPIDKRFPVNRPHAPMQGKHGPYLLPLLKRFLNKKIKYIDPEDNQKIISGRVKDAVLWRLLLNATQGDNIAIKEILNRIDGKVADVVYIDAHEERILQEEIELIPSNGKQIPNRINKFLNRE